MITGRMPTDRAERYARQLAGHWATRCTATQDPDGSTRLTMADGGVVLLTPTPGALEIRLEDPGFARVVAAHLERFGQRAQLHVTWDPDLSGVPEGSAPTGRLRRAIDRLRRS
ncbi:DUF2218 domain-containing protein [Arsenicicoccus dermatophilus]|uniref:DUF2218 domain-containing protein n=1 Tax=Arsenicicoccus dermatophilus TaxID=1076331 RepID=UPI001F4C7762|nr:DUF2218 domain-containing protein [Arsenicicoccus dermatophilus]MCH8614153.1 DUF2218 domain-containing protein [Arsenicicoccus dermatophilus]